MCNFQSTLAIECIIVAYGNKKDSFAALGSFLVNILTTTPAHHQTHCTSLHCRFVKPMDFLVPVLATDYENIRTWSDPIERLPS